MLRDAGQAPLLSMTGVGSRLAVVILRRPAQPSLEGRRRMPRSRPGAGGAPLLSMTWVGSRIVLVILRCPA